MPNWQWILGSRAASIELTKARDRRLSLRIDEPSSASFVIDGRSSQADAILELASDLHVYRDRQLVFRGPVAVTADTITADEHNVTVTALDYRWWLSRRIIDNDTTYTTQLDRDIVWDLIVDAQAKTGGDMGITRGPAVDVITSRTIEFAGGTTVYDAIQTLAALDNGFDWDILPDLSLRLWPQRGESNGVILDWGGSVAEVEREYDPNQYSNATRFSGAAGLTPQLVVATDIATRPEGRWEAQYGNTDIVDQAILDAYADGQAPLLEATRAQYRVLLRNGETSGSRWGGPSQIGLGDTCRLIVESGRLAVDTQVRVQEIDITVGSDDDEQVALLLDAPPRSFTDRVRDIERRLRSLERR